MTSTVLVLGGGVAGMSTAHELAERGFEVTVLEATDTAGGKARSLRVPGTGVGGRVDLPAEHGFRFFPGFYRHLPDTMSRIPYGNQGNTVLDNLRCAPRSDIAMNGMVEQNLNHFPQSLDDWSLMTKNFSRTVVDAFSGDPNKLSASDLLFFGRRILRLLTSCEERRFDEWEEMSWWQYSDAPDRNPGYQNLLAEGLTSTLVAARAKEMSARTGGYILLQLLAYSNTPGLQSDRVLCGPTNDVWIDPWLDYLKKEKRVDYRFCHRATALHVEDGAIRGVDVEADGSTDRMTADWYVAAVPVEHMIPLATDPVVQAEPKLGRLHNLTTRWMNGIQFYLRDDFRPVAGHIICVGSRWSITAISQRQFWTGVAFGAMGDGHVGGILSVDISNWEEPGLLVKKPAKECNADEIVEEVKYELRLALGDTATKGLSDANIASWYIDKDIRFPGVRKRVGGVSTDVNLEPLLVNVAGSWHNRPTATTEIANLFLASDYVRTFTDLASMEGANEAARRSVNGILAASRSDQPPCRLWPLRNPLAFAPARLLDRLQRLLTGAALREKM